MPSVQQMCEQCQEVQREFNAGDYVKADVHCQAILLASPDHDEALLLSAAIAFVSGDCEQAHKRNAHYMERIGPGAPLAEQFAGSYAELASAFFASGDYERAEYAYCNALTLDSSLVHARNGYGNLLKAQGKLAQARGCYDEVLSQQPTMAVAWNNLGCVNLDEGNLQVAVQNFTKAIYFDSGLDCVYTNLLSILGNEGLAIALAHLGNILRDELRFPHALVVYQRALGIHNDAGAHMGIATVFHRLQQFQDAVFHYSEAIRLKPNVFECHSNLGHALRDLGNLQGARTAFLNAVHLNPGSADDFNNLACICKDLGINHEAIDYYRTALRLQPDSPNVLCNLSHSLQMVCDWTGYDERMKRLVELARDQVARDIFPSIHPHHSFLYPLPKTVQRAIAAAHAKTAVQAVAVFKRTPYIHDPLRRLNSRLRVGYVSSDFKDHPTAHLMQSVPGFHDRTRVEVFCYSLAPSDGSIYRAKIEAEAEHFIDISSITDPTVAADRIYADGIHILLNLNGYTKGARTEIFALHPAPIQAMWLGYPGTSGADFIEYIITDAVTSPMEHWKEGYSERLVYMPDTFFVGDHAQMLPLPSMDCHATSPLFKSSDMPGLPQRTVALSQLSWMSFVPSLEHLYGLQQAFPYAIPLVQTNYITPGTFPNPLIPAAPYVQPPVFLPTHPALQASVATYLVPTDGGQRFAVAFGVPQPNGTIIQIPMPATGHVLPQHQMQQQQQQMQFSMQMQMQLNVAPPLGSLQQQQLQQLLQQQQQQQQLFQQPPPVMPSAPVDSMMPPSAGMLPGVLSMPLPGPSRGLQASAQMGQPIQPHMLMIPPSMLSAQPSEGVGGVGRGPALHLLPNGTVAMAPATVGVPSAPVPFYRPPPRHAPLPGRSDGPVPPQPPLTRAYYGLPEDKVVLCNFNQLYKLDPEIFSAWLQILKLAPDTVLWLLRFPAAGEANLRRLVELSGLSQERLVFSNVAGKIEHVRRGSLADLCLDTRACNGHTTGMDILWAGTPMVTWPHYALASRVAASQLTALGCPELIAESRGDYINKVVAYANNPRELHQIQAKVRKARTTSRLFDTRAFTRNLESAFFEMWRDYQEHATPSHIVAPRLA